MLSLQLALSLGGGVLSLLIAPSWISAVSRCIQLGAMSGCCMYIERVHPASASIIQSCDSPKLGTCACVRTAKNLYLNQINWKKFT